MLVLPSVAIKIQNIKLTNMTKAIKVKKEMTLENGHTVLLQEPVVVSASRSTDIPAFYCDWFFHRLKVGYSVWTNPFNGKDMAISYAQTRFIVFWSKNPRPLLSHLDELKERGINCYVQYSLNDYENEKLEKGVPPLIERIDTFKRLVDKLGFGGVIWRFDPLMLTADVDVDKLLRKIENIGDQLKGYTEKLIFSFADIAIYRKVKLNLEKNGIPYHEWTKEQMKEFAKRLVKLNKEKGWNYELATCGEEGEYEGIKKNSCIDDVLMIRRAYKDEKLRQYLNAEFVSPALNPNAIKLDNGFYVTLGNNKDNGQRKSCCCMKSKDIGQYNTCIHMCEYCYANTSKQAAAENYKRHLENPWAETIIGK